ncbi:hypothetical protein R1flu_013982 [Riccia fluitans]|uniref:Reverse transcriptase RNase H-like domain-containing protein n=1 Tax=Riccia fluitans TaxID=41844 RepID=A0ABD1YET7_9MARC
MVSAGVLVQDAKLVAYESKKLLERESHWPTHEKELYVVVYCLKKWQHYLGLHKTKVNTDNISLKYFETMDRVTPKQLRWHDTLALMDVELIHKPGKENIVPDALSRKEEFMPSSTQVLRVMYHGESDLKKRIRETYKQDGMAKEYLERIKKGGKKTQGLLHPLPIPNKPIESISMNFITCHPESAEYDVVLIVVDWFSKLPRFMGTMSRAMAFQTAKLFLDGWWCTNYMTANQQDWTEWLSSTKYCYNSMRHSATGMSPFLLVFGREPEGPLDLALKASGPTAQAQTRQAAADELLAEWLRR